MEPLNFSPRRILVTCPQRLGDVLLTTSLIHTLRLAWPEAQIDVMVLRGSEGILEGNPDVHRVIVQDRNRSLRAKIGEVAGLWRRYDLALAAVPTDRARLYAWIGGRYRVGFLAEQGERLKRFWLDRSVPFDNLDTHTVAMQARLAESLGIRAAFVVVPPQPSPLERDRLEALLPQQAYAVLHPCPKFRYKMWRIDAWAKLAEWLNSQGLAIVFSGGGDADELAYIQRIQESLNFKSTNLAGLVSLAQTASLMRQARLYVGPDTVATHLAAASNVPTLALFGPSNPVKWGPWPASWREMDSPWQRVGSGRQGNVFLLQGLGECVPCMLEGCERHVNSVSACLEELPLQRVIDAARLLLGNGA